jgi:type IV pilus biogenesis protein CpaD/CtpE
MHEDLRALSSVTERERPNAEQTIRAARLHRERVSAPRKEWLMSAVTILKRRPWLATGLAALLIALVLLAVPISYERTTGQEVNLALQGALEPAGLTAIAGEFKSALGAEHVTARVENGTTILSAMMPARKGAAAAVLAQAFAKELGSKGYAATASSRVVKERVSGNVYAYAADQMITIESAGKTAAQLEEEIKDRLAAAGVPDARVSVTDEAGGRKVKINVERQRDASTPSTGDESVPTIQITKNGVPQAGQGLEIKVEKMRSADGVTMKVIAVDGSRTATATIKNPDALGDAGLAQEIQSQLAAQGIQAHVIVQNGQISIEK